MGDAGDSLSMKERKRLKRVLWGAAAFFGLVCVVFYFWVVFPLWGIPFNAKRHGLPPVPPAWALECWLWEDDVNTAAYVRELLQGYAQNDIPVRTILIDSPWSTRYNDFSVDEKRYPEPGRFFKQLKQDGYRVVLWMTPNVNSRSTDTAIRDSTDWYAAARSKGYLVNNGENWKGGKWWKGRGGYLDYTNPDAVRWWQGMQQQVFDWGLDGWKLDGSDTLCAGSLLGLPWPYLRSSQGWITTRTYMDLYTRTEYLHGLKLNPEFAVMVRAMDTPYYHPEGFAPVDAAPVTWIGDRNHVWETSAASASSDAHPLATKDLLAKDKGEGIEAALRDILASSAKGYGVVGDDVAGYHGPRDIPPRLYIRWAEFAAFTGLFLNGGHGERRLWKRSEEELRIIRKFSWLHTELVPYMYSQLVDQHEGGRPLIRPLGDGYHYMFGDELLVAPIYRDDLTNRVNLPPGRWRYLFHDDELVTGPATFSRAFPLDELSVYVREGAILPLQVSRDYTGFGDKTSEGFLTLAIYPFGTNTLLVRHPDKSGSTTVNMTKLVAGGVRIKLDGVHKPHILRVHLDRKPAGVILDAHPLVEGEGWKYDALNKKLWIRTSAYETGIYWIETAP